MGAYLSEPITKKEIEVEENENFWVSSVSMQGWRVSQEDAHNAILNYDDFSSLFAVYDGHGGHEVAVYTAKKLPNFIKSRKDYRMGNIEDGLTKAFLEFDKTLTEREIVRELRVIANKEAPEEDDVDHEEVDNLFQEATMPIEAVMAQNITGETDNKTLAVSSKSDDNGGPASGTASALTRFKTRAANGSNKPISPFLRGKQTNNTSNGNGETKPDENKETDTVTANNENHNDAAAKLSFKDESDDAESKVINVNGSIEDESQKKNGHSETKPEDDTKTNGHDKEESNQTDSNGASDIKGKGKGKGKGKSNQIIKAKSDVSEEENDEKIEVEKTKTEMTPPKKSKSAKELYAKLASTDEVMDEESEEDDDEDDKDHDAFAAVVDDDDDDTDEEDDVEHDIDSDDTEILESTEEEDTPDEDEDDEEEYIGGDFNEDPGNDSGCTAVVALLVGHELYVANAGDSRCIVCRNGKAVEMSFDHKPEDEPERQRINNAGGRVTQDGRVNGGLNLSRAIGDHAYKTNKTLPLSEQMISPLPDIKKLTIDPVKDSFIFLACDGIWNSLSSQETVDFINERLDKKDVKIDNDYLTNIIKELFDHCLAPDTMGDGTGCDNMTAVIAKIKPNAFSNHKEAEQSEKTKVELETVNEGKRPAENEQDKIPEPQAKKAKIDNDSTEAATETKPEVEDEKTETKPEVVASAP